MAEQSDFVPMSPQLGVAGSSYRLQMGIVNNFWAIRLAKGNDVLESHVFKDEEKGEMPNANRITGWTLSVLTIPNINTFQIQKTVGFVRQKALEAFEDQKRKKATQGKSEAASTTLEKVPDGAAVKRIQGPGGWVKDDLPAKASENDINTVTSPIIERPIEISTPAPVVTSINEKPIETSTPVPASSIANSPSNTTVKSKSGRVLQVIPRGEGFQDSANIKPIVETKVTQVKNSPATIVDKSLPTKTESLEERVLSLEKRVTELESIIKELRK